jgi:hypothetical protein
MQPLPDGTQVEKINSVAGADTHKDGARAVVVRALGPASDGTYGYFVRWSDLPGIEVFIAGSRLSPLLPPGSALGPEGLQRPVLD